MEISILRVLEVRVRVRVRGSLSYEFWRLGLWLRRELEIRVGTKKRVSDKSWG
jgi:hypothetical protein